MTFMRDIIEEVLVQRRVTIAEYYNNYSHLINNVDSNTASSDNNSNSNTYESSSFNARTSFNLANNSVIIPPPPPTRWEYDQILPLQTSQDVLKTQRAHALARNSTLLNNRGSTVDSVAVQVSK